MLPDLTNRLINLKPQIVEIKCRVKQDEVSVIHDMIKIEASYKNGQKIQKFLKVDNEGKVQILQDNDTEKESIIKSLWCMTFKRCSIKKFTASASDTFSQLLKALMTESSIHGPARRDFKEGGRVARKQDVLRTLMLEHQWTEEDMQQIFMTIKRLVDQETHAQ